MTLQRLDHVNIRTRDLEGMAQWYFSVLGLAVGWRPETRSQGKWLYLGEQPVVHLVLGEAPTQASSEVQVGLEHFAFTATDWPAFEARLVAAQEPYQCTDIHSLSVMQCNITDPDGNHVHVDFALPVGE